jgi:hypothetical protein
MDRQARNRDAVLVKIREMTGRSQTLLWWLGGGGVKTTETSNKGAPVYGRQIGEKRQNAVGAVRAIMCTAVRNRMKPKEIREFAVTDLRSAD